MTTAVEITQYEQEKEMYRKMGINIEAERYRQAWEDLKPIRKALFMEQALKTKTVLEVKGEGITVLLERDLTKADCVKMLYDRAEYLKSEIADFENCNGGVEWARLMAIKEQVSCIYGLIDVADKELFKDVIRVEQKQTNEEWLRSCNTEQLAEWIAKIVDCDCCPVKRKFCDDNPCKIRFAEWLKQPHREEQ